MFMEMYLHLRDSSLL